MELIEQAIFTSAETDRASGYQVAAASPGVCEADLRELAAWGPSHDALLDPTPSGMSVNFHPLPSGAYCVSRTTPSGWEYSGRGIRMYTQCFVVPPTILARFANNPFALVRAATASGSLRHHEAIPNRLEPIQLAGRTPAVDSALLAQLRSSPGPTWMAAIVQAALDSVCIAIAGGPPAEQIVAGLINCLPPECRTEFSFSTGLKFSSRRPYRIVALSGQTEEQRRMERLYNIAVLRLSEEPPAEFSPVEGWPRLIHRVMKSGRISFFAARLSRLQRGFALPELPLLGLQLLEELDAVSLSSESNKDEASGEEPTRPGGVSETPAREQRQAHAAHQQFGKSAIPVSAPKPRPDAPSRQLGPNHPEVLEKLERLDDLVFEAISGRPESLEQLRTFWPQLQAELDDSLLAESREQYLRYAMSVWSELRETDGTRDPSRAAQSLEVLSLLFDKM